MYFKLETAAAIQHVDQHQSFSVAAVPGYHLISTVHVITHVQNDSLEDMLNEREKATKTFKTCRRRVDDQ